MIKNQKKVGLKKTQKGNSQKTGTFKKKEEGSWIALGTLRPGCPDRVLLLPKPFFRGTYVLVELDEGRKEIFRLTENAYRIPIKIEGVPKVLRKATLKEIKDFEKKIKFEDKAWSYCKQFAQELGLEMHLLRVECFFDRSKIIFYYTAPGRIDFRQLVKDLARALRMRIEMRQVGVRNATALLGGIGYCGRELCCAKFINKFTPLSIKMVREEGLILDPNKISGPCGRLLCCINYEYHIYKEFLQHLPEIGSKLIQGEESFKILKYNMFQNRVYLEKEDKTVETVEIEALKNYIAKKEEEDLEEEEKELKLLEEE